VKARGSEEDKENVVAKTERSEAICFGYVPNRPWDEWKRKHLDCCGRRWLHVFNRGYNLQL